jgi:hypothetical protein
MERARIENERLDREGAQNNEVRLRFERQINELNIELSSLKEELQGLRKNEKELEKELNDTKGQLTEERTQRGILLKLHKGDQEKIRRHSLNLKKIQNMFKLCFDNMRAERDSLRSQYKKELSMAVADCRAMITAMAKKIKEKLLEKVQWQVKLSEEKQKGCISASVEHMKSDFERAERDLVDRYEDLLKDKAVMAKDFRTELERKEEELRSLAKENTALITKTKIKKQKLLDLSAKINALSKEKDELFSRAKAQYEATLNQKELDLKALSKRALARERGDWQKRVRKDLEGLSEEVKDLR